MSYLKCVYTLAELLPLQQVRNGSVHTALTKPDHLRRHTDPTHVQNFCRVFVTVIQYTK